MQAALAETTRMFRQHQLFDTGQLRQKHFNDPSLKEHYPPDLELEPIHLDVDLRIDLADATVSGAVITTVQARREGPQAIALDAVDFEDVAVRDATGEELSWEYEGKKIRIRWQRPFQKGEERQVVVSYRVTSPTSGLYFSRPDEAYPGQAWYAASDHETERARHWLPCVDLPNVRTTIDYHLRATAEYTILANGKLDHEEMHDDGTKTAHWQLAQRCPSYLACIAIGDFTQADDGAFVDGEKEIPLSYFCSREHSEADLLRTFGRTGVMMAWLTEKLELPFPYPKYFQFALPGIGGAMENISLTSWSDRLVQNEALATEAQWLVDQINLHELSHSYFGDAVVCRDFAHAWLKESWATYLEQVYREDNGSRAEADFIYYENARTYIQEADERYQRPIMTRRFKSSWDLYDAHLYEGGACRLHTLRCELGDEIFWTAVRDYLQRFQHEVVETDDFRLIMEEYSGRSLGKFFDQWFRKRGYPDLKVTFNYDAEKEQGTFTVTQQQVDVKSGIPAFSLQTTLSWTMGGETVQTPVRLEQERHTFTVSIPQKPDMVRFDPGHQVLHKLTFNPGDKRLRRQLTDAPDVIGRIQAAHTLAETSKRANIQAIVDAYETEAFWGVRREFARALGEANHETAVAGLAQLLPIEQDPMVLPYLTRAAGNYRDERINQALQQKLAAGLPPIATQTTYQALGAQRQHAPYELLRQAADEPGCNGIAQGGALLALAATREEAAIPYLEKVSAYGAVSNRVRPAAIIGLAQLGRGLDDRERKERIIEQLIDLLRDPWPESQWAAARGLRVMKATAAIDAVETFGRSLSHQEQVAVEQIVASLRQEDKVDGSAVKKQIEDLTEKVRKLEEQLQKIVAEQEPEEGSKSITKRE